MPNKKPIYISAWKNDMKVLNWPQSNTHILNTPKSKTSNNKSLRLMRVTSSSIHVGTPQLYQHADMRTLGMVVRKANPP